MSRGSAPTSVAFSGVRLLLLLLLSACGSETADFDAPRLGDPLVVLDPQSVSIDPVAMGSSATVLAPYERLQGLTGVLSSAGSDTLANLMTLWSEAFQRLYPSITIQVQAAGSSSAPPALTEGTVNFGAMSRAFNDSELDAFEQRFGYVPTALRVAIDAVAVYVHKDNPIDALALTELDAIFSATRLCGARRAIDTWGDMDLAGGWFDRPIQLYGRNSVSGTYGYFKSVALCGGDYRNTVNEQPGSSSVVQAVAASLNSIGYAGMGHGTSGVRALPLRDATQLVVPTASSAADGSYPLSRFFYVYVHKRPDVALPAVEREFLRFVLSAQGQEIVARDGYVPVSASIAATELKRLD